VGRPRIQEGRPLDKKSPKRTLVQIAANGSNEPRVPDAALCTNGRYHEFPKNLQQLLGFCTGFVAASNEVFLVVLKRSIRFDQAPFFT
jgi:hypothetical protein